MNWLDLVFIGIIAVSVLVSAVRGFVRECLSLIVWIGALWLALRYCDALAGHLEALIASPTFRLVGAFAIIFIAVLLLGAVLNHLAGKLVGKTGLTGTDRVLGLLFGALRGVAVVALAVLLAGMTAVPQERWWRESVMTTELKPWVCAIDIGVWLRKLRVYEPVAPGDEEIGAARASNQWRGFCGGAQ